MQYFRSKFARDIATASKNNDLSIGMVNAPEKTGNHEHKQAEDAIRDLHRAGFKMKPLSIVGKGYRSEEYPIGFYTLGDRNEVRLPEFPLKLTSSNNKKCGLFMRHIQVLICPPIPLPNGV